MPRFVILEHDHPVRHWDFMLEMDGALTDLRLPRPPENDGEPLAAMALADHRLFYLDHEGPVSGGRGTVRRWDGGEYEPLPPAAGDLLKVRLTGHRIAVIATLHIAGPCWVFAAE